MTDLFYLLVCLPCNEGMEPLVMPFPSECSRGEWAALHTAGTGHDKWWVAAQQADGKIL